MRGIGKPAGRASIHPIGLISLTTWHAFPWLAEANTVKRFLMIILAPLLMLASIIAAVPATASGSTAVQTGRPAFSAPAATPAAFGVNYHPMWASMTTTERATVLDSLATAGTQWVRIDVAWGTIQPTGPGSYDSYGVNQIDTRIREVRAHGMKILLMFYWAPKWSSGTSAMNGRPGKAVDYANAAAWVAKRYDGSTSADLKIHAMELWNEPDLDSFWVSSPATTQISDFANLIKTAGPAVKAANPNLTVVVGATASVNTSWYQTFYQTPGIVGTYDALGVHPYQSPGDAAPSAYDPQYGQYYMKHIPVLSDLMSSKGDPASIWATEFGWSTHSNTSSTPNWQKGVTESEQAQFLLDGAELMGSYPRVQAAFWYNARNTNEGDVHFDSYGLSTLNNSPKPAFYAFKCVSTGVCDNPGTTAPPTPTGLNATATGTSTVNLTWNAASGATSYTVLRDGAAVANTTTATFSDSGLQAGTTYAYTVKANNEAGASRASDPATVTTEASVVPAAPTGLTATSISSTSVVLSWNASPGATSYVILRNGRKVGTSTTTEYKDSKLRRSTNYTYTVKAVGPGGTSPASAALKIKTAASSKYSGVKLASFEQTPVAGSGMDMARSL